jgi:hypothetical protein
MVGIKQDTSQTLTRGEVMKAREEDAKKIRKGQVRRGTQTTVKGYTL